MPDFQPPVGTFDILPPESARWQKLLATFVTAAERAGYGLVVTPVIEDPGLFRHGAGESTDVVRKEMYEFEDKGGRPLALRPEGTAPVMRTFLAHKPPAPWKVWYVAPNFRYERPQAGRYRQHHQVGIEAIGSDDPDLDVEVVGLLAGFYRDLGLRQVTLLLNTLGDAECRPAYREALRQYLTDRRADLCDEHRNRIDANPLRILDCKRDPCLAVTADAPLQADNLCRACAEHFERVQAGLKSLGVDWTFAPRLVRGLDYYTRTTFEFAADALDTAQNAIGGGGRYDGLAELLGGVRTPGIGFGAGVERILLACDAEGALAQAGMAVDVFVIDVAGGEHARDLTHDLRSAGISADRAFDQRSMKAQMKAADRSGARVAVVVGEDELATGKVALRDLRGTRGQELVDRGDLVAQLRDRLGQLHESGGGG